MAGEEILVMLVMLVSWLATLTYHLPKLRRVIREEREAGEIMRDLVAEYDRRFTLQNEKLVEQQVKIDLIEVKLNRLLETATTQEPLRSSTAKPALETTRPTPLVASQRSHITVREEGLTPTERGVLGLLTQNPRTSREIQEEIGKSREHTARLLKGLFERGYVSREDAIRPYVYRITDRGRRLVISTGGS